MCMEASSPSPCPMNSVLFKAANPSQYLTLGGSFECLPLPLNSMLFPVATGRVKKHKSRSSNIDFRGGVGAETDERRTLKSKAK